MKANEIILMVSMFSVSVFCFVIGLTLQGWFWSSFLVWFGVWELTAKNKTGKTLSQWVWTKPMWVRVVLSLLMLWAFASLGFHFIWGDLPN